MAVTLEELEEIGRKAEAPIEGEVVEDDDDSDFEDDLLVYQQLLDALAFLKSCSEVIAYMAEHKGALSKADREAAIQLVQMVDEFENEVEKSQLEMS